MDRAGQLGQSATYQLKTGLTPEQVRERFATPETVPFWQLPLYIDIANHAGLTAAGYRLQFQKLLARPFLGSPDLLRSPGGAVAVRRVRRRSRHLGLHLFHA